MNRPAKLKLTKAEKAAALDRLKAVLGASRTFGVVGFNSMTSSRRDWVLLGLEEGRIVNLTREVAAVLDRQYCSFNKTLCPWLYDSPGSLKQDLNKALGFDLFLREL